MVSSAATAPADCHNAEPSFPHNLIVDDYQTINRQSWNRMAESGSLFAKVATDEQCRDPLKVLDGRGWLPESVVGLKVLCLASGGGWQSVLYAVAGADVTVVDLSDSMLALDEREARRRGLKLRTLRASMDDLRDLNDEAFDIVHQPVSTCYIPDLVPMYAEVARVLKDDGLYISQHKQPTSLQISHRNERHQFVIGVEYYHTGPLPKQIDTSYREAGATEYLHRLEDLIGGLVRSRLVLEDLREPIRADYKVNVEHYGYRGRFVPPYVRMKARRMPRTTADRETKSASIWTP
ncbi:MAG: class I SAM-dependent methyltransferase [Planctomycetaceae bacterium]